MASVAIAKPGSVGTAVIAANSVIGTTGGTDIWPIKMMKGALDFFTKLESIYGDGDTTGINYGHNCLLYGNIVIQGWMIATHALDMQRLIRPENPYVANTTFNMSDTISYGVPLAFERMRIEWQREAVGVGVLLIARANETATAAAAPVVAII